MSTFGKFPQVQVGMVSNLRTRHGNKTEDQHIIAAEKEDATDPTATTATTTTTAPHEMENKPTEKDKTNTGDPKTFEELTVDSFGLPYQQICFMTGKELRDIGDHRILGAYMKSRALIDHNYLPRKRNL